MLYNDVFIRVTFTVRYVGCTHSVEMEMFQSTRDADFTDNGDGTYTPEGYDGPCLTCVMARLREGEHA